MKNCRRYRISTLIVSCLLMGLPFILNAQEEPAPTVLPETPAESPEKSSYALTLVNLDQLLAERPDVTLLSLTGSGSTSVFELIDQIEEICQDDTSDAILLNFEQCQLSWAHADHLRRAIQQLREEGHTFYAYVETPSLPEYLLACACDKIIITPTGDLMLTGLAGEAIYFKNLMDKIGLGADIIHVGAYKSAAEPFTRTEPSEADLEQTNLLFDGLYDHMIQSIASSRNLSKRKVTKLIDQGPFTARQALKAKLVDKVMYRKEFIAWLEREQDKTVAVRKPKATDSIGTVDLNNPLSLFSLLGELMRPQQEPAGDQIAILYITGAIMPGKSADGWGGNSAGSQTIRLAINEARTNPKVKALVVRIDSPGGSATASDIICQSLLEASAVKPVIVSMGSVAASGGYYIACGGTKIFAEPSTLTGSIGVIGGKLIIKGLLDKIGVTTYSFKRGQNAAMFSSTEPFSEQERRNLSQMMKDTYATFKQVVRQARQDKLTDDVENLAQGKVYTGRQALECGLIDEIGGLHEAIAEAARQVNIQDWEELTLPRPKTLMDLLDELLAGSAGGRQPMAFAPNSMPAAFFSLLQSSGLIDRQMISQCLALTQLLQQEQTCLMTPCYLTIH